jgi:hypothetical protein
MFETLFKYPRVLARHREDPVADARERFLTHCAEQGLARESLLRTAREVLIIAKHIDLTTGETISIHDVDRYDWSFSDKLQDFGRAAVCFDSLPGSPTVYDATLASPLEFSQRRH